MLCLPKAFCALLQDTLFSAALQHSVRVLLHFCLWAYQNMSPNGFLCSAASSSLDAPLFFLRFLNLVFKEAISLVILAGVFLLVLIKLGFERRGFLEPSEAIPKQFPSLQMAHLLPFETFMSPLLQHPVKIAPSGPLDSALCC